MIMIQSDTDHCGVTVLTTHHGGEIHLDDIALYLVKCLAGADVGQKLPNSLHHQYHIILIAY